MSVLTAIGNAPGLDAYLDELEERLEASVRSHPGIVSAVGGDALAAGGKRLRPLLVFLASTPDAEPPLAAGVAVELVHMATLIHDDLIDGAEFRRGRTAAWAAYGPEAARATGDYLFARAFSELTAAGDAPSIALLTEPALGEFGLALGIAFQITDDILDCSGETVETGKIAGVDLREGTPTLPLLLAAQRDRDVRSALAGGPLDGALVRVAATGALEESREIALDYARKARAFLNGHVHRDELEALTHLVVDRDS